jgi:hypothetical protein
VTLEAVSARATAIPMANCVMLFGMIASIHPMIAGYGQRGTMDVTSSHNVGFGRKKRERAVPTD